MSFLELSTDATMRREEVAARLRQIADMLERHNDFEFTRDGLRYTVDVPDQVRFDLELEVGNDGSELEIEIKW